MAAVAECDELGAGVGDTGGRQMSDVNAGQRSSRAPQHAAERSPVSGWAGWVVFAGVAMIMVGVFQVIEGLVALLQRAFYLVVTGHMVVHVSYTAWGWVHIIVGGLLILIGFGVIAGLMVARVLGIALAVVSAIVNLAFIPAYPVWGVLVIALDVVVIYALAVHGHEVTYE